MSAAGERLPVFPPKAGLAQLLAVSGRALAFWPPLWLQSFFGPAGRWLPPHEPLSEFRIVDPRRPRRALEWLSRVGIPASPHEPPGRLATLLPRRLSGLLWRPTVLVPHPGPGGDAFPRERWFFVNGIVTDKGLSGLNAALLVELFGRPITVIQNATRSLPLDVREVAIGKEFKTDPDFSDRGTFTEPGLEATIAVLDALARPEVERVVVIAHSQGTIIVANVLRAISTVLRSARSGRRPIAWMRAYRAAIRLTSRPAARQHGLRRRLARSLTGFLEHSGAGVAALEKLEVYTFANCADKMTWVDAERRLPRLEHFANERDWVARLGVLSPCRGPGRAVQIDGRLFSRAAAPWPGEGWGHLLNECYLMAIRDHLAGERDDDPYRCAADPGATPRLYGYFRGGRPDSPRWSAAAGASPPQTAPASASGFAARPRSARRSAPVTAVRASSKKV